MSAIWDNMDESWECYDRWNKLHRKRQEPYDFVHIKQNATNEQTKTNS